MTGASPVCIHATCLELASGGRSLGILLRGASGSGKSMLALRLMDEPGSGLAPQGSPLISASLVSDDQVCLRREDAAVFASAPGAIAGLLEVRGVGVIEVSHVAPEARLGLVIDHAPSVDLERLPAHARTDLIGVELPLHRIDFSSHDAPSRVRLLARLAWGELELASDRLPQDLAARR